MANVRKSLGLYAEHAGMTKEGARQWLIRVGIDYLNPFDFSEADRLIKEARHASRTGLGKTSQENTDDSETVDLDIAKNPLFIESQARREKYKADLTELEYEKQVGKLIPVEDVDKEWFRIGRIVRETLKNIGPRLRAQLAAESDPFQCEQLLDEEIDRVLEVMNERVMNLEEVA